VLVRLKIHLLTHPSQHNTLLYTSSWICAEILCFAFSIDTPT